MAEQEETVGLRKKNEDNDIETYISNASRGSIGEEIIDRLVDHQLENMRHFPEEYFNFGFSFEDFKQFLLKMLWMRTERRFLEKKLKERPEFVMMMIQEQEQEQAEAQGAPL